MKLKKLGMVLVVICALGVVMASSAFAKAETEDQTWTIVGVTIPEGTAQPVESNGSGTLVTTVGTTPLELTSTEIKCLSCTIENSGGSAVGSGSLEFQNVKVKTPSTCKVNGEKVTTVPLKVKADYMIGTSTYVLFEPATGTQFAELKLEKGTGGCAISNPYTVTGKVFAKSTNGTGVDTVTLDFTTSGAINKEASGEEKPLLFGGAKAELNGEFSIKLKTTNVGKAFGTK